MAKIRSLALRDIPKVKKMILMISNLSSAESGVGFKSYLPFPFNVINRLMPLCFKFASDSYVAIDDEKICGLVTIKPQTRNPQVWRISKLFLDKNRYDAGRQLVSYATAKYGAMGANTFFVKVEDSNEELIELFSKGCGFRVCASDQVWELEEYKLKPTECSLDRGFFRPFKNTDAKKVCDLHNELLFPHFRYSLSKIPQEYENVFFNGLHKTSYFKYVIEDGSKNSIKGYCSIKTDDNKTFILDIDLVSAFDDYFGDVINFAISQIMMRRKNFKLFVINRKYKTTGAKAEAFLKQSGFKNVKNEIVLVKDYYKRISESEKYSKPAIVFSEISAKRKPAFKTEINV